MRLAIRELTKIIDDRAVINKAGYTFEQGKVYALVGGKGAGKTTFFNCVSGEWKKDSGKINIIEGYNERKVKYSDVLCTFHEPALPGFMTGREFIKYYMDIHEEEYDKTVEEYLDMIKLDEEDRNHLIRDYSDEIKNRIQILCVYISSPAIILLENPMISFDKKELNELSTILNEMKENHILLVSTTDIDIAKRIGDEIVVLANGNFCGFTPDRLDNHEFASRVKHLIEDLEEDND